MIRTNHY